MKLLIAESRDFSPGATEILRTTFDVHLANLDQAGLLREVSDSEVLWVRLRNRVNKDVMHTASHLRCIVTNTTGLNHIDLDAAASRGIRVLSLRGEVDFLQGIRATAELTLGLLLALVRHIPAAAEHACKGGWDRDRFIGNELHGKTAAVVGYGRLGRLMGRYLKGLNVTVLAVDPSLEAARHAIEDGVAILPLAEALPIADMVTIHINFIPERVGVFCADAFSRMKPHAWFVNTARGELVDERALLEALESGRLAGAALDVLADERSAGMEDHPLVVYARTHNNLLLTPHIGGNTVESSEKTEIFLAEKLVVWARQP